MELVSVEKYDTLNISEKDRINILEYKISRTVDKKFILEIKLEVDKAWLKFGGTAVDGTVVGNTTEGKSVQE